MGGFTIIWIGQIVSLLGSGMTQFALAVWVYELTGSATQFALTMLFGTIPQLLLLPFVGALVDRWDRRRILFGAAGGGILVTLLVAVLFKTGQLSLGHIYLTNALLAVLSAFQLPTFFAATAALVPQSNLGRAAGMSEAGASSSRVLAPLVAAALLPTLGTSGVVILDSFSFALAAVSLLLVRIPRSESVDRPARRASLLREALNGWRFLSRLTGHRALLGYFAFLNFTLNLAWVLLTPLVLSRSSPQTLSWVLSTASLGMVLGGVVLGIWGGPSRRVVGILGGGLTFGFFLGLAGVQSSPGGLAAALFVALFSLPILNGCYRALWQTQAPKDLHGRFAAITLVVARSTVPVAFAVAGPLADRVFDPLLMPGGALVGVLGGMMGVGAGRGTGLLFMLLGILTLAATARGYLSASVWHAEDRELEPGAEEPALEVSTPV